MRPPVGHRTAGIMSPMPTAPPPRVATSRGKRLADIFGALIGLVLASPVLAVIAAISRLTQGSPVLFRQLRPGYRGEPFELIKFRTMSNAPPATDVAADAQRLTSFGKALRSTSLDELPELWNVLRGDMSLVGPRPLLIQYLDRYTPEQFRRHDARPGLTGLAQVEGRNTLTWEERFALDLRYIDTWSHLLDLKLILATIGAVVGRRGISQDGSATMTEFMGTPPS